MSKKNAFQRLCSYGYAREEGNVVYATGKTQIHENYAKKTLNHIIVEHVQFIECIFDEASVTGSIFRYCEFVDCSLDMADFEFCDFYGCKFQSKVPVLASFNESCFTDTLFLGTTFRSCTFTGAFFQGCQFDRVKILVSTLENSIFRQCQLSNMDLRVLNMDFTEFDQPKMNNVILPLDQIPFAFGFLQYLYHTEDSVKISKGEHGSITPLSFFNMVVPLLCSYFIQSEQFFPLANIYFATGQEELGFKAITDGLRASIALRDFRMIKHFCKLIAYSGAFPASALHNLYHNYICRLYPRSEISPNSPNYARHIVEIKALLFQSSQKASFRLTFGTNIKLQDTERIGTFIRSVFSIAKHGGTFQDNDVELTLRQNSPLQATIQVSGNEYELLSVFSCLLTLAGIDYAEMAKLPVVSCARRMLPEENQEVIGLKKLTDTLYLELQSIGIRAYLLEYYADNFHQFAEDSGPVYYFNSNAVLNSTMLKAAGGTDVDG